MTAAGYAGHLDADMCQFNPTAMITINLSEVWLHLDSGQVARALKYYMPHLIFFGVFLAALVPVLYYYRRRNPNPHFRPRAGEITLIAVMALVVGGGACFMLGNVFRGDQNFKQYIDAPNEGAGWSQGASGPRETEDSRYQRKE